MHFQAESGYTSYWNDTVSACRWVAFVKKLEKYTWGEMTLWQSKDETRIVTSWLTHLIHSSQRFAKFRQHRVEGWPAELPEHPHLEVTKVMLMKITKRGKQQTKTNVSNLPQAEAILHVSIKNYYLIHVWFVCSRNNMARMVQLHALTNAESQCRSTHTCRQWIKPGRK